MKKVILFLICVIMILGLAVGWLMTSPYCAPKAAAVISESPDVELRAAMDIGSGATNIKIAKVDRRTDKIIQMLFERSIPVAYQKQLEQSPDGTFNRDIMNQGIKAIKLLKETADEYGVKKVVAVATAAFRQTKNGDSFIQEIRDTTGVDLEIISQDDEGLMAFRAAVAKTPISPEHVVVWDIGGGSLQMTAQKDNGELVVGKGSTASAPFKNYIISKIQGKDIATIHTPNPMNAEQMQQAIDYAASIANESITSEIKDRLKNKDTVVLAAGNLFNHGIRVLIHPKSGETTVTKAELLEAVHKMEGKSDVELSGDSFAEVAVSNPLLVIGFMNALGIDKVTIMDINNADGALTYPAFWEEEALVH